VKKRQALIICFYKANIFIHFCMEHVEIPVVSCILNTATGWEKKPAMTHVADIFFSIKFGISIMLG